MSRKFWWFVFLWDLVWVAGGAALFDPWWAGVIAGGVASTFIATGYVVYFLNRNKPFG